MQQLIASADVVHGHAIYYPSFDGAIAAAIRYSKPLVLSPYLYLRPNHAWSGYARTVTALARSARPIYVAVSEYEREVILDKLSLRADATVTVIQPLVETPDAQAPRHTSSPPSACYIGRINRAKGVFDLPVILDQCRRKGLDLRLTIVGPDDGALVALQECFRSKGLIEAVEFVGLISEAEKQALLSRTDYLLLPSSYEAYGIVLAEAMSAGCIPVAYATGATPEVLGDGRRGSLVEYGDRTAFAEAVLALAGGTSEALAVKRMAGLTYVKDNLGFERWLKDWASVYHSARA